MATRVPRATLRRPAVPRHHPAEALAAARAGDGAEDTPDEEAAASEKRAERDVHTPTRATVATTTTAIHPRNAPRPPGVGAADDFPEAVDRPVDAECPACFFRCFRPTCVSCGWARYAQSRELYASHFLATHAVYQSAQLVIIVCVSILGERFDHVGW